MYKLLLDYPAADINYFFTIYETVESRNVFQYEPPPNLIEYIT